MQCEAKSNTTCRAAAVAESEEEEEREEEEEGTREATAQSHSSADSTRPRAGSMCKKHTGEPEGRDSRPSRRVSMNSDALLQSR